MGTRITKKAAPVEEKKEEVKIVEPPVVYKSAAEEAMARLDKISAMSVKT